MLGKLNQLNSKKQGKVYIVLAVCLVSFFIIGIVAAIGGNLWANKNRVNDKLVVVSPHPVSFMEPLINEFEIETGIQVDVKSCGTTEAIQMIEEDENVDLMWGGSVLTGMIFCLIGVLHQIVFTLSSRTIHLTQIVLQMYLVC